MSYFITRKYIKHSTTRLIASTVILWMFLYFGSFFRGMIYSITPYVAGVALSVLFLAYSYKKLPLDMAYLRSYHRRSTSIYAFLTAIAQSTIAFAICSVGLGTVIVFSVALYTFPGDYIGKIENPHSHCGFEESMFDVKFHLYCSEIGNSEAVAVRKVIGGYVLVPD